MNATRLAIIAILGTAIFGGALLYYQLVYAGYAELNAEQIGDIQLVDIQSGAPASVAWENLRGIDTVKDGVRLSGAISFRACFDAPQGPAELAANYVTIPDAVPLTAPSWFECFDAREIGAALEDGGAVGFMSAQNISFGVDRVIAVLTDGRGFAWHQLNACGEAVFAGDPAPQGCPDVPEDF